MSRREQVEELLADVLPRIEELKQEALAEIEKARRDATQKASRYEQAREELARVEEEICARQAEREELPMQAYRAGLDGEFDREMELQERYRNLRPAIEGLEDRKSSLKGEIRQLLPNSRGHRNDVRIEAASRAGAAYSEREVLEGLRDRLLKALDDALEPVTTAHDQARGLTESMSKERDWDLSPVGRGALR